MIEKPLREEQNQLITASLVTLAAVAVAMCLYYTRVIMVPFVLAMLVASLTSPLVDYQVQRLKFPKGAAVVGAMLAVVGILLVFGIMLVITFQTINDTVKEYSQNFAAMSEQLVLQIESVGIQIDYEKIRIELSDQLPAATRQMVGTIGGLISSLLLVMVFAAFLLTGRSTHAPPKGIYREIDSQVRKYLAIKVVVSLVTGIAVWLLLWLLGLGVRLAFVFGIMSFLLNFIPSLGSIVATLLPIPVAVAKFHDPWLVLLVIGLPAAVQLLIGNVIEPKLQGSGLNLHPVIILMSLALWGLLWGVAGMVLAVPITAVLRIVLLQFETTRPIGNLLAGKLP